MQPYQGERPYLSTGGLNGSEYKTVDIKYNDRPSRADLTVLPDDLIMARMQFTPKVFQATKNESNFIISTGYVVFRPKKGIIHPRYLYHYLKTDRLQHEKNIRCTGATQKAINNSKLNELKIPLPSYDYQTRIAEILDKADALRQKRKESIKLLDDFLRSTFLEMFGDPFKNEMRFKKTKIIKVLLDKQNAIRTGPFGSQLRHSEFTNSGVPVLGIDNIVKNQFNTIFNRFLPPEKYAKFQRYRVFPDDIIITIMGTTGKVAIAPDDLPTCISTKHLCVLSVNKEIVNPVFLWATLLFDNVVKNQTKKHSSGAIMEGWNMTIIKNLIVRIPPIELQNKFADIVRHVEKLKAKYKESEKELDNLFGSLMQRAFQGEL